MEWFRKAKAGLTGQNRREIPDGDPGAIFDRALTLLLEDVARKKVASTSQPRNGRAAPTRSRHIPRA